MAIYHLEAKIVSRGAGRSAVAAAAYLSCSRMLNQYDGVQHDYTRKQGLGWRQVFLPAYGAFDSLAVSVLREQKKQYPQIELILVLAYLNTGRDTSGYDITVYPPLETVPRRFAISHRNRWMVESADVVVAYVLHDWGGAATTLRCAKQKKKQIISYRDEMGS